VHADRVTQKATQNNKKTPATTDMP
jgi:hypothetical protein